MFTKNSAAIITHKYTIDSVFLKREVIIDCYYSEDYFNHSLISLLLINDGQDLRTMAFELVFIVLLIEKMNTVLQKY